MKEVILHLCVISVVTDRMFRWNLDINIQQIQVGVSDSRKVYMRRIGLLSNSPHHNNTEFVRHYLFVHDLAANLKVSSLWISIRVQRSQNYKVQTNFTSQLHVVTASSSFTFVRNS